MLTIGNAMELRLTECLAFSYYIITWFRLIMLIDKGVKPLECADLFTWYMTSRVHNCLITCTMGYMHSQVCLLKYLYCCLVSQI